MTLAVESLPEISLENVLTIVSFVAMGTIYVMGNRSTMKIISQRLEVVDATMEDFKEEMKGLTKVVTEQAVQNTRLTVMEGRLMAEGARVDALSTTINKLQERLVRYMEQKVIGH